MGQSLQKLAPGNEAKNAEEIAKIAERIYSKHFPGENWTLGDFYQALSEAIEEVNKSLGGNTQFRAPKKSVVEKAFDKHHKGKGKDGPITQEEFQQMMRDVIMEAGVSGTGAKDMLLYVFGVPFTTLMIKRRLIPRMIPDELFIPGVTSATVFVLAMLNKL